VKEENTMTTTYHGSHIHQRWRSRPRRNRAESGWKHDSYLVKRGREILAAEGKDETTATADELFAAYQRAQAEYDAVVEGTRR
jgi:hypothetical protein